MAGPACKILVKDNSSRSGIANRLRAGRQVCGEAALVAALGAVLAFAANQVSPRGLALTRDYFPAGANHEVRPVAGAGSPLAYGTNVLSLSPGQFLADQMKEKGLQLMDSPPGGAVVS